MVFLASGQHCGIEHGAPPTEYTGADADAIRTPSLRHRIRRSTIFLLWAPTRRHRSPLQPTRCRHRYHFHRSRESWPSSAYVSLSHRCAQFTRQRHRSHRTRPAIFSATVSGQSHPPVGRAPLSEYSRVPFCRPRYPGTSRLPPWSSTTRTRTVSGTNGNTPRWRMTERYGKRSSWAYTIRARMSFSAGPQRVGVNIIFMLFHRYLIYMVDSAYNRYCDTLYYIILYNDDCKWHSHA